MACARSVRSRWLSFVLFAVVLAAVGCGGGDAPADAPAEDDLLVTAIAVAKEIEADPDSAEEILARHGLDAEGFEAMMYDIAGDPERSRAYNDAVFGAP